MSRDDVRAHLLGLEKTALVDILMAQAEWDPRLRARLAVETAKGRSSTALDVPGLKESLRQAIEVTDYVDWRGATAYANAVDDAIDALVALFEQGHDADLLEVVEHAMKHLEEAAGQVDDDGNLGPLFERLHALHFAICERARPEPLTLARRLFEWELTSAWHFFDDAATKYADVFGPQGLAEYRRLAELAASAPSPTPAPRRGGAHDAQRRRAVRMLSRLTSRMP